MLDLPQEVSFVFLCNSKPFVRQALHNKFFPDQHKHLLFNHLKTKDSRLFFIVSGKGIMNIEGVSYAFDDDTVILFKAGTEYEWQTKECDYYSINFDYSQSFSDIKSAMSPFSASIYDDNSTFDCGTFEDFTELNQPIIINNAAHLRRPIGNIVTECVLNDEYSQNIRSSLMQSVIYEILRLNNSLNKNGETKNNSPIIKQIAEYVYLHYSEDISNEHIAAVFNYNPTYIGRIFKKFTGVSLHSFIVDYRIQVAKELLKNQRISVDKICKTVGFNDYYHFIKIFKSKTGQSPSKYRKSLLSAEKRGN